MPLVNMRDMLTHAQRNGYAVGAFDLVGLEYLEGIMIAAERCNSPVILSLAEPHFNFFDFELIMPAVEVAARRASVPVSIHLAHGESFESAVQAINLGCNGLMIDSSYQSITKNTRLTRAVVEMAHSCGVPVEGQLVDGSRGFTAAEAKVYVQQTGVDFLAVSIGMAYGPISDRSELDYERLQNIHKAVGVPLAIHGNAGLTNDQYQCLIASGVAKINYYTALADMAGICLRDDSKTVYREGDTGFGSVKHTISNEVARCMYLWGSSGRATELLSQCTPWESVDHLIIYNISNSTEHDADTMMAEGRRVLSAIPGVREVVTGRALTEDAKYRYTWLVRFCHPAVIDSYRHQPEHVSFADRHFRPIAADRVSIDYKRRI